MCEESKYPISETKFKELIEPVIKKAYKNPGRLTKISNYNFFAKFCIY